MSGLTPPRWQRVQDLCELLEALPPEQREARLQALEGDPVLRQAVLDLLQDLRDEEEEQRLHRAEAQYNAAGGGPALPGMIGGVRIVAYIGSGGSGDVYRGVRTTNGIEQTVAVKRFHTHRASAADLERFAREQRMLATLTHPAIVRFLDAGIEADGRPYLIMELADGLPIIEYCDQYALSLAERLQLFTRVCEAVQSAHQHQILHLDLKPSNVLVTGKGEERHVKLVDFGTAKLADPSLGATRTEPLTVQYASPERLRGDAVSEACDVFGLGLMLFELSSGGWPYHRPESLVAVVERASGTARTRSLSQSATDEAARSRDFTLDRLRGALRGDLEAVTGKALAHDPGQRYPSVAALAEDVRRHLSRQPILARAPRFGYVASRWVRRHAWPVTSAAIALVAIAAAAAFAAKKPPVRPGGAIGHMPGELRTSVRRPNMKNGFQIFDDFVKEERTTITGATWKGGYCAPLENAPSPKPNASGFLVGFYADADNHPNQNAPLQSTIFPVEQTGQTLEAERKAGCGPVQAGWAFYRYTVTLDTPFVAEPGVRYWFSVMAMINEIRRPNTPALNWAWQGMFGSNERSVLIAESGERPEFNLDRVFTLIVKP